MNSNIKLKIVIINTKFKTWSEDPRRPKLAPGNKLLKQKSRSHSRNVLYVLRMPFPVLSTSTSFFTLFCSIFLCTAWELSLSLVKIWKIHRLSSNMLTRRKESDTYLASVSRHRGMRQNMMNIDKYCSFQPALCASSAEAWPKPGDRRNFNTHKTRWKCRIKDKRPTGKKHTTVGWDNGGKIGKIIN